MSHQRLDSSGDQVLPGDSGWPYRPADTPYWATEDVILGVLKNWQKFSAWVMDYKPEYLHGGHLIDRAGYKKFKEIILDGVELNPECLVAEDLFWQETEYRSNFNVKPLSMHHTAGPKE